MPINATIVHALTLLHPGVQQPDGGRMYRCLTEFPGRTPGGVVPMSTLTFELDGGQLWPQIADWERVVNAVVHIARYRGCDAMPMGLSQLTTVLVGGGPNTVHELHHPDGSRSQAGPTERQQHLDELVGCVRRFVAEGPFWPGDDLVEPPPRAARAALQAAPQQVAGHRAARRSPSTGNPAVHAVRRGVRRTMSRTTPNDCPWPPCDRLTATERS